MGCQTEDFHDTESYDICCNSAVGHAPQNCSVTRKTIHASDLTAGSPATKVIP